MIHGDHGEDLESRHADVEGGAHDGVQASLLCNAELMPVVPPEHEERCCTERHKDDREKSGKKCHEIGGRDRSVCCNNYIMEKRILSTASTQCCNRYQTPFMKYPPGYMYQSCMFPQQRRFQLQHRILAMNVTFLLRPESCVPCRDTCASTSLLASSSRGRGVCEHGIVQFSGLAA